MVPLGYKVTHEVLVVNAAFRYCSEFQLLLAAAAANSMLRNAYQKPHVACIRIHHIAIAKLITSVHIYRVSKVHWSPFSSNKQYIPFLHLKIYIRKRN